MCRISLKGTNGALFGNGSSADVGYVWAMDVVDLLPAPEAPLVRKRKQPAWIEPMRATLTKERFSDPAWIYEPKLDGERCLVFKRGADVRLMSRNQKTINSSYPEIAEALARQPHDLVIDSEVVAFDGEVPSFSMLQRRMHVIDPERARRTGVAVFLHAFDLVYADGYDITRVPLLTRKKVLKKLVSFRSPLRFVAHRKEHGEAYYEEMCSQKGWEGLIAKRAGSEYRPERSRDWLKFKCSNEQEFVIGGYTDPQGSRTGLGALLVGYYDGRDLRYAGKVGTGFDTATLGMLTEELTKRERPTPPFVDPGVRNAHWVEPELVAQIGFAEWTGDGRLRHPRYLGLRRDKPPRKVVRESR
jgi:bifunctional non-homologous end joining protein LigD